MEPYLKCKKCGSFQIIVKATVFINSVNRHRQVEIVKPDPYEAKDWEQLLIDTHYCTNCKGACFVVEGSLEDFENE